MKTYNENTTLLNFEAWSCAIDTKERIVNEGKAEDFDALIEKIYPDGLSITRLNDTLWFQKDWIFEMLGISEEEEE